MACAQLARLEQPAVVSPAPSRTVIRIIDNVDLDHDPPAQPLEHHHENRRVQPWPPSPPPRTPRTPPLPTSWTACTPRSWPGSPRTLRTPTGSWTRQRPSRPTRTKTTVYCAW
ncbi:hypothetical protein DEJ44_28925 [Streptomyces venezuelae]|nr:hypothetical protein DEJ44_28925 [Streptomyces venezuelae]